MFPVRPPRSLPRRLAASRRAKLCDEEGLEPALRLAQAEGEASGFDDLDSYLNAVLEGETEDVLGARGWRRCARPGRCLRAGRCLRRRGVANRKRSGLCKGRG